MLSDHKESAPFAHSLIVPPIRNLEDDFPFLFKVVEFRFLLLGHSKEERIKYSEIWFDKEKTFASLSSFQREYQNEYALKLLKKYFHITVYNKHRLAHIFLSGLHKDLQRLTQNKLSGTQLKELENKVLLELKKWVIATEDQAFFPFLATTITETMLLETEEERKSAFKQLVLYYCLKHSHFFSHLNNNKIDLRLSSKFAIAFQQAISSSGQENNEASQAIPAIQRDEQMFENGLTLFLIIFVMNFWQQSEEFLGTADIPLRILILAVSVGYLRFGRHMHNAISEETTNLSPLEFSKNMEPLINAFFRKTINNFFITQKKESVGYQAGNLPTLQSMLTSFLEEPEPLPRKEKIKTKSSSASALASLAPRITAPGPKSDHSITIDPTTSTQYIKLNNNLHFKFNSSDIERLFEETHPKESGASFSKDIFNTVTRQRKVDVVAKTEGAKKNNKYVGCSHKVRIKGDPDRLGVSTRPPTEDEKKLLNSEKEIYSPRKVVSH